MKRKFFTFSRSSNKGKWSDRFNAVTAKLSKGLTVTIAVLPIAGLFLGISAAVLTNLPEGSAPWIRILFEYLKAVGDAVFSNLPALFAIAVAVAFAGDAGVAGFAALVGWIIFNALQSSLIIPQQDEAGNITHYSMLFWSDIPYRAVGQNLGIRSLQTAVFGGILIGGLAAYCYNRFHQITLPNFLGFFAGTRMVPIVLIALLVPFTLVFSMIWPVFSILLGYMGVGLGKLNGAGNLNALFFGYIERSLIPFGVHHAYYAPLWYSSVGGEIVLDSPALLGVDQGSGFGVYKVVGTIKDSQVIKANLATWKDVLGALNPNADLQKISEPSNWQGDNVYFQRLNAFMVGRQLRLEKIFGAELAPTSLDYTLTYKTFSTSTFNRAAAVALFDQNQNFTPIAEIEKMVKTKADLKTDDFLPAFPSANIGSYQQGKFAFMIFGIPAAAAAMIMTAPKENRKEVTSILGSAALTSFLTGITEPFEFTFLFVSPLLFWGLHATLAAFSFWLTALFGANIGQTFSGGIIDLVIYGFIPDIALGAKANSYVPILVGLLYIPIYFFSFYFLIKYFDLPTPGRGGELISKTQYQALKAKDQTFEAEMVKAFYLVEAYGGVKNIQNVDSCVTKLRVTVNDTQLIDNEKLKAQGYTGNLTVLGNYVVAIFGTASDTLKIRMQKIIQNQVDVDKLTKFVKQLESQNSPLPKTQRKTKVAPQSAQSFTKLQVLAPVSGKVVFLDKLEDESFKLLGQGVAIEPTASEFFGPLKEGVLELFYPSGHAYIFDSNGLKVMVHVGIETVKINPAPKPNQKLLAFGPLFREGQKVSEKNKFLDVDWKEVEKHQKSDPLLKKTTPIIVLNESLGDKKVKVVVKDGTTVKAGEILFEIL